MEKIDRLSWAAGISFETYGLRMGVRVTEPSVLGLLKKRFPPGCKPSDTPVVDEMFSFVVGGQEPGSNVKRFHIVYIGAYRLARTLDINEALKAFQEMLQLYVADGARRRVFVHAGVVGWHGKAIVIPGRSMSGKSQLVDSLVHAGATYFSDEFAVFDMYGRVHPYATPLRVRHNQRNPNEKLELALSNGSHPTKPLPVGLVLFTHFKKGARWRPYKLTPGRALMELLPHSAPIRRKPKTVLSTLQQVVLRAPCLKGVRGEANKVAVAILERVQQSASAGSIFPSPGVRELEGGGHGTLTHALSRQGRGKMLLSPLVGES